MDVDLNDIAGIRLLSAERSGDVIVVYREMEFSDGTTVSGKHTFPADTLEWRAAEYGIDPDDLDTLLDIVLYEPFLGEPDRPDLLLYDADTIDEARDYHLDRIEEVKAKIAQPAARGLSSVFDVVRDQIKTLSDVNDEAVRIKEEFVSRTRGQHQEVAETMAKARLRGLFVDPSEPEERRLEMLRARLMHNQPNSTSRGPKIDG